MKAYRSIITILVLITCGTIILPAQETEQPLITVMDFETNEIAQTDMTIFLDFLSSYIIETGRFRVLERSQRENLLKEMEFSMSGCTDESCQLEIGKLLSADYLILGSIGILSEKYIINIRLVNVDQGETLTTFSEEFASMGDIIDAAQRIIYTLLDVDLDQAAVEKESSLKVLQGSFLEEYRALEETIDTEAFYAWCDTNGYLDLLNNGSSGEKLALIREYLDATRVTGLFFHTSGFLVTGGYRFVEFSEENGVVSYEDVRVHMPFGTGLGIGLGLDYVLPGLVSFGLWVGVPLSWLTDERRDVWVDPADTSGSSGYDTSISFFQADYDFGFSVGYGDCYRGMAARVGIGVGQHYSGFHLVLNGEVNFKRVFLRVMFVPRNETGGPWTLFGAGYSTAFKRP